MFQPAPCGPAAAVWSSNPALVLIDDFGQLAATELGDVEIVLPLTGRRFVTARGAKLTLPSGLVTTLPPNAAVLGGAVMADGKSVTLLAAHAGGRQLIVVSLGTGQITQRCAILSSTVRLAIRRGLAIVQLESRVLWLLDLHAGRELGTLKFDHDVDDFVVDLDGHRLAVRAGHGAIELHQLVDLLRRPAASIQAPAESERPGTISKDSTVEPDVITSAPRVEPGSEASDDDRIARMMRRAAADIRATWTPGSGGPAAIVRASDPGIDPLPPRAMAELRRLLVCPPLTALDPRPRPTEIDRALAHHQLGRELRKVALWTLGAIAAAWDSRKLGYGNEGKHPYELEVGAILGMNQGFAGDYLAAAREQLAEHEDAIAGDVRWRAVETPIGAMTSELGLDPLAVDIVLVIAAAALWGEIARLYGIVANDAGRATVDELLVQQVLEARHDRHSVAAALDPRGPLVRLGIVQMAGKRARPFAELTVDPVVLDRLRAVEPDLGHATTVRSTDRDLASLDISRDVLEAAIAALARHSASADRSANAARIVVRGRVGDRGRPRAADAMIAGRAFSVGRAPVIAARDPVDTSWNRDQDYSDKESQTDQDGWDSRFGGSRTDGISRRRTSQPMTRRSSSSR